MPEIREGGGCPIRTLNPVPQDWVTPSQATINIVDTTAAQTISNKTFSGSVSTDTKVLAADVTITSSATLTDLTGFSWALVAGATYVFESVVPITATVNGGLAMGFGLTGATLTSVQVLGYISTATDNAAAVSVQSTTATSGTKYINTKTAAYTYATIRGSLVVNAAGTLTLQVCQETSAGGGDVTVIKKGTYMRLIRAS